jgi:hypothetical protein
MPATLTAAERARWAEDIARDFPTLPRGFIDLMLQFYEEDPKRMRQLAERHRAGKVPPPQTPADRPAAAAAAAAAAGGEVRLLTPEEEADLERRRAEALAKSVVLIKDDESGTAAVQEIFQRRPQQ